MIDTEAIDREEITTEKETETETETETVTVIEIEIDGRKMIVKHPINR